MALSPEILNESELAKSKITSSKYLDDDYKRTLLNIINTTTIATNGITPEEKIQKMTEAIHMLAVSQVSFITALEDTVIRTIEKANSNKCNDCIAQKHAKEFYTEKQQKEAFEAFKKQNGIKDPIQLDNSWQSIIKQALLKPGIWIFGTVLIVSPYSFDIIKLILEFINK